MSYQQELHTAHKERLKRLGMFPQPPVVKHSEPPLPPPMPSNPSLPSAELSVPMPVSPITALVASIKPSTVKPHRVTIPMIINAVAVSFGIGVNDIKCQARHLSVCRPRQVAMCIAREMTTASTPQIGRHFGGRDHTTVLHATRTVPMRAAADPALAEKIATIKEALIACCQPRTTVNGTA